jgi:hypothetical protein
MHKIFDRLKNVTLELEKGRQIGHSCKIWSEDYRKNIRG